MPLLARDVKALNNNPCHAPMGHKQSILMECFGYALEPGGQKINKEPLNKTRWVETPRPH